MKIDAVGRWWIHESVGHGRRGPKLRVERRPFLASKAAIFGVNFTGPHILVVIFTVTGR